ncbi:hypothetical protein, partial [Tropheryma whipplei]|uniref:hypothetical protein n=1 Tax=Tropheryma whipplei TaxID=2039 RepID=UPI0019D3CF8E
MLFSSFSFVLTAVPTALANNPKRLAPLFVLLCSCSASERVPPPLKSVSGQHMSVSGMSWCRVL